MWMGKEKSRERDSKLTKRHLYFLIFEMGAKTSTPTGWDSTEFMVMRFVIFPMHEPLNGK